MQTWNQIAIITKEYTTNQESRQQEQQKVVAQPWEGKYTAVFLLAVTKISTGNNTVETVYKSALVCLQSMNYTLIKQWMSFGFL